MRILGILVACLIATYVTGQQSEGESNSVSLTALMANTDNSAASTADVESEVIVLNSDVDKNIPKTATVNKNAVAVVIGNRDYKKTKDVQYAINDSRAIKKYLVEAMGFKEGNILYIENATRNDFEVMFGSKSNPQGKLFNAIRPGESDVFVFYSGHGAPDLKEYTGYFVPVDSDPNYVEISGYSTKVFFNNLSAMNAKSVTVVMDACFSGTEILENISPVGIKSKEFDDVKNGVMLSSSAGTQVSSWYVEKNHGMFTYFFLKAIQDGNADYDGDGVLRASEIYQYVADKSDGVPYYARLYRNVEQTPTIQGDQKDLILVQYE